MPPINITGVPNVASDQNPAQYYFGTVLHLTGGSPPAQPSIRAPPSISSPFAMTPSQGLSSTFGDRQSSQTASGVLYDSAAGLQGSHGSTAATLRSPDSMLGTESAGSSCSCPFEDVTLGHLLGKGSFGSVYFGRWNDQKVAVKVRG